MSSGLIEADRHSSLLGSEFRRKNVKSFSEGEQQQLLDVDRHKSLAKQLMYDTLADENLQDPDLFEKDYIQSTAKRWLVNGAGIGAILLLPFGPFGLAAGAAGGLLLGLCAGLLADLVKLKRKHDEAEKQKLKIKHLMRWAEFHFATSESQLQILLKVILEYRALAAVGAFSRTARTQLRMLYRFLRRSDVQHVLWLYINYFFMNWDKMNIAEIGVCHTVFEVCIECCQHLNKKQPPVVNRMDELLRDNPAVRRLFAQADCVQRKQRERAVRNQDWVVYADAHGLTAQEVLRRNIVRHAIGDEPIVLSADELKPMKRKVSSRLRSCDIEPLQGSSEDDEDDDMLVERGPDVREGSVDENDSVIGHQVSGSESVAGLISLMDTGGALASKERGEEQAPVDHHAPIPHTSSYHSVPAPSPLMRHPTDEAPEKPSNSPGLPSSSIDLDIQSPLKEGSKYPAPTSSDSPITLPRKRKASVCEQLQKKQVSGPAKTKRLSESDLVPRRKQLFRSYADMVKFDETLKHQTPIGIYEIGFLVEMETHDKSNRSWDCTVDKPTCRVYKYKSDSPVVLVKAYAKFPEIPCAVVGHFIRHIPTRIKWDKTFDEYHLVEKDIEGNEVIYCMMRAPWPIANRDFLQWRLTRMDDDGSIYIIMRSASHPNFPERSGIVRAETIVSGGSSLFLLAQTDVRGLLPKFAVNQAAQRAPVQWTESLRKACTIYVKKGFDGLDYASTVSCY